MLTRLVRFGMFTTLLVVVTTVAACSGSGDAGATAPRATVGASVTSVSLAPHTLAVVAGTSRSFAVEVRATSGTLVTGVPVVFATSDAAVASVDALGQVTGGALGSATITATEPQSGRQASAVVQVIAPGVDSVRFSGFRRDSTGVAYYSPFPSGGATRAVLPDSQRIVFTLPGKNYAYITTITLDAEVDAIGVPRTITVYSNAGAFTDMHTVARVFGPIIASTDNPALVSMRPLTALGNPQFYFAGSGTATLTITVGGKSRSAVWTVQSPP